MTFHRSDHAVSISGLSNLCYGAGGCVVVWVTAGACAAIFRMTVKESYEQSNPASVPRNKAFFFLLISVWQRLLVSADQY
jgi:hypothetical protein